MAGKAIFEGPAFWKGESRGIAFATTASPEGARGVSLFQRFLRRVVVAEHSCAMPDTGGRWLQIDSLEAVCSGGDYTCAECGIVWARRLV